MNRTSLPIHEIHVIDRQRFDLGDIADLADSINRLGLIQPIVVNQDNRLIAGGRRLAAHLHLGRTHIDVVYRETLTDDELHELELEENIRRKEMLWTERCLNIVKIHELKWKRAAVDRQSWGVRQTGELLGMATTRVQYAIEIAKKLRAEQALPAEQRRYWKCENFSAAWNLRLRDQEDELQQTLAANMAKQAQSIIQPTIPAGTSLLDDLLVPTEEITVSEPTPTSDIAPLVQRIKQFGFKSLTRDEAQQLYRPSVENPSFDEWYTKRCAMPEPWLTIPLTSFVHHANCIDWMLSHPGCADHIITDPPYGIEMSNLAQQNQGIADIDTVEAEHEVDANKSLLAQLFPAAFTALKDQGFFVLWCDQMHWNYLYTLATNAGFTVQRWPLTWVKTHACINQAAQFNFTKTTEIAMVCRKSNTTLVTTSPVCHILASHDDYKDTLGHPFVKPFDVWAFILNHVSYEGQTILEPFAGRGSGAISILRCKRKLLACEIDTAHYPALLENLKRYYLTLNPHFTFA